MARLRGLVQQVLSFLLSSGNISLDREAQKLPVSREMMQTGVGFLLSPPKSALSPKGLLVL